MLRFIVDAIGGCPLTADCGGALLVVATTLLAIAAFVQAGVMIKTWLSIQASTGESKLLRQETAALVRETSKQVRLTALPILEVRLHRGPDTIFLGNVARASAASAASRVLLRGFRFSWNGETWRCSFGPTGLIAPGQEVSLDVSIEQEPLDLLHSRSIPPHQIFSTALSSALTIGRPDMNLDLYFEDMLGNCYRSEVKFDFVELDFFLAAGPIALHPPYPDLKPTISKTILVGEFPESLEPLDRTA